MDKLKMQTSNLTDKNIEQIAKLFPNVMTETKDEEGYSKRAVNFDLLKQCLSDVLVDDENERYRLDWPGKKSSILKANTPINKTLRPCREDSVDFDTTENVYIEGDNFEVLKILQESYLGKIKMIYIDPPYNTGKDFIYSDRFKISREAYDNEIRAIDEEGDKLFRNTDTNGRFHSDWLSMMYERLTVARDLLKDDGVIFISIDDNEITNLRRLCDDVFGEENFLECFIWVKRTAPNNVIVGSVHEYVLIYMKSLLNVKLYLQPRSEKDNAKYANPDKDPRGAWTADNITSPAKGGRSTPSLIYELENPHTGEIHHPPNGRMWSVTKTDMLKKIEDGTVVWGKNNTGRPMNKRFLSETRDGKVIQTLITDGGSNSTASKEVQKLFDNHVVFETPKPIALISKFIILATKNDDIILDFFSGSATVAHSTNLVNLADKGNRKYIMVQLPEKTNEESEAFKAGYKTISEIGKERIRRAGKKIKEELEEKNKQLKLGEEPSGTVKLDIGFRVYKTDSTNMKDVYYHPDKLEQANLFDEVSNIKEGRTPDDLLTQVILDLGLELSLPIEIKDILGNTVFVVQYNALVACFDDSINFEIVDEIAGLKPFKAVFKDASFTGDKDRINVEERFKRLSPETVITVI
jgi:adenine-specific DNA-methyltransferase